MHSPANLLYNAANCKGEHLREPQWLNEHFWLPKAAIIWIMCFRFAFPDTLKQNDKLMLYHCFSWLHVSYLWGHVPVRSHLINYLQVFDRDTPQISQTKYHLPSKSALVCNLTPCQTHYWASHLAPPEVSQTLHRRGAVLVLAMSDRFRYVPKASDSYGSNYIYIFTMVALQTGQHVSFCTVLWHVWRSAALSPVQMRLLRSWSVLREMWYQGFAR